MTSAAARAAEILTDVDRALAASRALDRGPWVEADGDRIVLHGSDTSRPSLRESSLGRPAELLSWRLQPVARLVEARSSGPVYEPVGALGRELLARVRRSGYARVRGFTALGNRGGWVPAVED